MNDVLEYLEEREEEFKRHLEIARMLQARVDGVDTDGQVEVRHVNTIKSGLLIHLYNIVEAITTRTLVTVGKEVVAKNPRYWTKAVLKEWVRAVAWDGEERLGDKAIQRLVDVSETLALGNSPTAFVVKGEPGSWDDKSIKKVANRLGCPLNLNGTINQAICEPVYINGTTALTYLSSRRNAIAHGECTFEDGAGNMTLGELTILGDRVLPYLRAVTECYRDFLEAKSFLRQKDSAS